MEDQTCSEEESHGSREKRFMEFIRLFNRIESNGTLFPKVCRTCGREFTGLTDYLRSTIAKGHCLEDCCEVMRKPFTMIYRHCSCGNTLVLTLTEDICPTLDEFWDMIGDEASRTDQPIRAVVLEFSRFWDKCLPSGSADRHQFAAK